MTLDLQNAIENGWEDRTNLSPTAASASVREAVAHTLDALDTGSLRVAEKLMAFPSDVELGVALALVIVGTSLSVLKVPVRDHSPFSIELRPCTRQ